MLLLSPGLTCTVLGFYKTWNDHVLGIIYGWQFTSWMEMTVIFVK